MTSPNKLARRDFLKTAGATAAAVSAAVALPTFIPSAALGRDGNIAPSEKITLGVIGIGPRCTYDLSSILPMGDVRCVAIADVQASRRDKGKDLVDKHYGNKDLVLYRDFRELLDRKDIDAVLIATGDRWHTQASIMAAEKGKDVYSEKPCGITIADCQRLAETMHSKERIFQAGTQRRSVPNFQKAVELAHTGKLGKLQTLYASIYMPTLDNTWLPGEQEPARAVCDWNLWLGPAAWRPYNKKYVDGGWRGQWDFDSGARLLDWGAHTLDLCQWANQADDSMPIEYEPGEKSIVCTYKNGVKLILDFLPEPFGKREPFYITRLGTCPVRFVGDEGSVETGDAGELVTSNEALLKDIPEAVKRAKGLDVSAHARNFFDSIRSRKPTAANPDVMRRSHIACHAAALAWILRRKLTIDPAKEEFVNDDEANLLRSRGTRKWES